MDKLTKGMIKALIARLEHISNPQSVRENEAAPDRTEEADVNTGSANPGVPFVPGVPRTPPPVTQQHITCKPEKDWWDKTKPLVEIGGAILLAVYTFYTIKMYCSNRDAANAATMAAGTAATALTLDQRAWMKATVDWTPFLVGNNVLVRVSNIGKGIAQDLRALAVMQVIPAKASPSLDWRFKPHADDQFSIVFPGDPEEPFPVSLYGPAKVAGGSLPPRKLTVPEVDDLTEGNSYLTVSGEIIYSDQFGKHWTHFCAWHDLSIKPSDFNSRACILYNAIGDGDPPKQ